jgi:hypothetical protein
MCADNSSKGISSRGMKWAAVVAIIIYLFTGMHHSQLCVNIYLIFWLVTEGGQGVEELLFLAKSLQKPEHLFLSIKGFEP